jgi:hypothetical protein
VVVIGLVTLAVTYTLRPLSLIHWAVGTQRLLNYQCSKYDLGTLSNSLWTNWKISNCTFLVDFSSHHLVFILDVFFSPPPERTIVGMSFRKLIEA